MNRDKPTRPAKQRTANRRRRSARQGLAAAALVKRARSELAALTGLRCEGVTAVERCDDGTCTVSVELLELSRIPETDDVLGSYDVELDGSGEVRAYRRVRRYARSQTREPSQPPVED